jgi:hypothetical protein
MRGIEPAYTLLADQGALSNALLDKLYGRMPGGQLIKTTRAGTLTNSID